MRGTFVWLALTSVLVATAAATEILKVSVGGTPGLDVGTFVKVSGDNTIAVCNEGDVPVGVIIGYEDDGGSSYYLIVSSGMVENVLLASNVTAGDRLVPAAGGAVQRLSGYPTGYVVGIALEDGSAASRTKIMVNLELGGGSDNQTIITGDGVMGAEAPGTSGNFTIDLDLIPSGGLIISGGKVGVDFGPGTNQAARGNHTFGDHPDVSLTGLAIGDLVGWNGTSWINFPSSYFATSAHTHTVSDAIASDITGCGLVNGTWNLQVKYGAIGNEEIADPTIFANVRIHGSSSFNITDGDNILNLTGSGGVNITHPDGHTINIDASDAGEFNQTIVTGDGVKGAEFPGTSGDFTIDVDLLPSGGLKIVSEKLAVDFGTATNQVARGDHTHPNMLTGTGTDGYNAYFTGAYTLAGEQYVATSRGGLGANMTAATVGSIPYANTTTTYGLLSSVAEGNALISGGVGSPPSWGKIQLSGTTTHIAGTLPVASGGTGLNFLGTPYQMLRVNSGGYALEWWTPNYLTTNQTITLSGDVTGSGSTAIVTTIGNDRVDNNKLANMPGYSIKGNPTGFPGDPFDIQFTSTNQVLGRLDGNITPIGIGSGPGQVAWGNHTHEGLWDNYVSWTATPYDGGASIVVTSGTEVRFDGTGGATVTRGVGNTIVIDASGVTGVNQNIITGDGIRGAEFPGTRGDVTLDIDLITEYPSGLIIAGGKLGVNFGTEAWQVARGNHTHTGLFDNYGWWTVAAGAASSNITSHSVLSFVGTGDASVTLSGNTVIINATAGSGGGDVNQVITTRHGITGADLGSNEDITIDIDLTTDGGLKLTGTTPYKTVGVDFGTGSNQVARGNHTHYQEFAGDVSGSGNLGSGVSMPLSLSTTGVTPGTYGSTGAQIPNITVDSKGRITWAFNRTLTASDIGASNTDHTHTLTHTGDVTGTGLVSGTWALTLSNTGVTPGIYGNLGGYVANINIDAKGRITSASNRLLTASDIGAATSSHTHSLTHIGDVTGSGDVPGTWGLTLSTTGVTAGTYGNSGANVAAITVDSKGRLTSASNRALTVADIGAAPSYHTHAHGDLLGIGPNDHHNRLHAMTSTSDHSATAWRIFYSNGSGYITELALGSPGQFLKSTGTASAPIWEAITPGTNYWTDAGNYLYPNGGISTNLQVADVQSHTYGFYANMTGTYGGYFYTSGSYGIRAQGATYGIYAVGTTAGYFSGNVTITGDLLVGSGSTTGKINCYEIDPAYKIGEKHYSVYGGENIGHRIDIVAMGKLNEDEAIIDLSRQQEGSSLWLFSKVVDLSSVMVMVSPNGPANLYAYVEGRKVHVKLISGEKNTPFTFRLTGTRLDKSNLTEEEMNSWRGKDAPIGYIEIDPSGKAINRYTMEDMIKNIPESGEPIQENK